MRKEPRYEVDLYLGCYVLQEGEFSGLIPLINKFLDSVDVDYETRCTISQYLKFMSKKASGKTLC